ncbi:hypothetical protein KI688_005493 [Linnemannia hyalina]|uniref:Uncharacterized protein n=1 Tax=Linnemannia hyalina TaxID=64524 RepID=A0A9P7Y205_9FUNG|nr:hypothetical protein KI688_005493 [Linnemannia hyalina]
MEFCVEIPAFSPPKHATTIPYGTEWREELTGVQLVDAHFPRVRRLRAGWKLVPEEPTSGKLICSPHHLKNIPFVLDEPTVATIQNAAKELKKSTTPHWIHFYTAGSGFYLQMRSNTHIDFWTLSEIAATDYYRQRLSTMIAWLNGPVKSINTDLYTYLITFLETHRLQDSLPKPLDYQAILSFAGNQWLSGEALDGIACYFQRELGISPQGQRTLFVASSTIQHWTWQWNINRTIEKDKKVTAFFEAGRPDRVYAFALIRSNHWIFYRIDAVARTLSVGDKSSAKLDHLKYAETTGAIKAFVKLYFPTWKEIDNAPLAFIKVPRQDGVSCGIIAAFAVEHDILFKNGCHGWEEKNIPIYRTAYLARVIGYEKAQGFPLLTIKSAPKVME